MGQTKRPAEVAERQAGPTARRDQLEEPGQRGYLLDVGELLDVPHGDRINIGIEPGPARHCRASARPLVLPRLFGRAATA
jgi:hypothetical protein